MKHLNTLVKMYQHMDGMDGLTLEFSLSLNTTKCWKTNYNKYRSMYGLLVMDGIVIENF